MSEDTKIIESVIREKQGLVEIVQSLDTDLKAYKELGSPTEIAEALDKGMSLVAKFEGVDLNSLSSDLAELAAFREIGTVKEVDQSISQSTEVLESYLSLGSPVEIDKALTLAQGLIRSYKKFGSPEEVAEAMESISVYEELGTTEELTKALDILEERVVANKCEQVAAKHNSDSVLVRKMYEKVQDFKVVEDLLDEGFSKKPAANRVVDGKNNINESTVRRIAGKLM